MKSMDFPMLVFLGEAAAVHAVTAITAKIADKIRNWLLKAVRGKRPAPERKSTESGSF